MLTMASVTRRFIDPSPEEWVEALAAIVERGRDGLVKSAGPCRAPERDELLDAARRIVEAASSARQGVKTWHWDLHPAYPAFPYEVVWWTDRGGRRHWLVEASRTRPADWRTNSPLGRLLPAGAGGWRHRERLRELVVV